MATMFTKGSIERTRLALREAAFKLDRAAPRAEHSGALIVARNMQARAPVDTGALRASIHVDGSSAVAAAPYAIPVDRGTVNMAAHPFAEDAADASHTEVTVAMTAVFRTALGGR